MIDFKFIMRMALVWAAMGIIMSVMMFGCTALYHYQGKFSDYLDSK